MEKTTEKTTTKKAAPTMTKLMGAKSPTEKVAVKQKDKASEELAKVDPTEGKPLTQAKATNDLLASDVSEIESLKEERAFKLVASLTDDTDHNNFKLGGILLRISSEGWFLDKGYENFSAYVEAETSIKYRKAQYLIGIYSGLVQSGVSWAQISHIGWTKIKELAPHLTPDNLEWWLQQIDGLNVKDVIALVKKHTAADPKISDTPSTAQKTTTMSFKLHEDQYDTVKEAIDKAKHESGTDIPSVALEFICLDYLSGSKKTGKVKSMKELMAGKTAEEVLEIFGEVFPDVELEASIPG